MGLRHVPEVGKRYDHHPCRDRPTGGQANFLRLKGQGVFLRHMKTVYINFDSGVKKAEREKILAELNWDDRVLFARREWPG